MRTGEEIWPVEPICLISLCIAQYSDLENEVKVMKSWCSLGIIKCYLHAKFEENRSTGVEINMCTMSYTSQPPCRPDDQGDYNIPLCLAAGDKNELDNNFAIHLWSRESKILVRFLLIFFTFPNMKELVRLRSTNSNTRGRIWFQANTKPFPWNLPVQNF